MRSAPILVLAAALSLSGAIEAQFPYTAKAQDGIQSPLVGPSLTGFSYNPTTRHAYYRTTTQVTKAVALSLAQQIGGYLVCIGSAAENSFLVQNYGSVESFWIGLSDEGHEGSFRWDSGEPLTYTNWGLPTEPNNCTLVSGSCVPENDVVFNQHSIGGWNDMNRSRVGALRAIIEVPVDFLMVYARLPTAAEPYGHAFLGLVASTPSGLSAERRYGFYLRTWTDPSLPQSGCISDEATTGWSTRTAWAITRSQYDAIATAINADLGSGPTACQPSQLHSFLTHNSTDWVREKAAAGGITLPPHQFQGIAEPQILNGSLSQLVPANLAEAATVASSGPIIPQSISYLALAERSLSQAPSLASVLQIPNGTTNVPSTTVGVGLPLTLQLGGTLATRASIVVSWGDGQKSYQSTQISHTYFSAGPRQVTIAWTTCERLQQYVVPVNVVAGGVPVVLPINHTTPVSCPDTAINTASTILPPASAPASPLASNTGPGCGTTPAPSLSATTPTLGTTMILRIFNDSTVNLGAGYLVVSAPPTSPFVLAPGCNVYLDFGTALPPIPVSVGASTTTELPFALPADPAFVGAVIAVQAGFGPASVGAPVLTNGLGLRFGF